MTANRNIPYYFTAIAVFILLKFAYTLADNTDLYFLLKPTDKIIEVITNSNSIYVNDGGYFHDKLNIVIDKSCSGFNFWILCFIMLAFTIIKFLQDRNRKIAALPITLFAAYIFTIFANTSRILFAVFIRGSGAKPADGHISRLHQAEGTFVYLFFLIIFYLGVNFTLTGLTRHNAKLT